MADNRRNDRQDDQRNNRGQNNRPREDTRTTIQLEIGEITRNGDFFRVPVSAFARQGNRLIADKPLIVSHEYGEMYEEFSYTPDANTGRIRALARVPIGQKKVYVCVQLSGTPFFSERKEITLPEITPNQEKETDFELDVSVLPGGVNQIIVSVIPPKEGIKFLAISRYLPNGQKKFPSDEDGIARTRIKIPAGEKESVVIRQLGTNKDTEITLRGPEKKIPKCNITECPASNPFASFFAGLRKGAKK
ncbi:MAG: hypothetical protein UV67_C0005G0019 [Parcubacteria group bacterium GW2011_GWC1_43_12]|nr:MAG: hypothetical protein UV34_C0006G0022 [Parcubacteria group bacterium GW2011_GWB1_42_6]KKS92356.1 MAG: hypothetical protein UV67_C0005G0019 [Parcubacteria group bacterium GW2011_GWC1_43_12]